MNEIVGFGSCTDIILLWRCLLLITGVVTFSNADKVQLQKMFVWIINWTYYKCMDFSFYQGNSLFMYGSVGSSVHIASSVRRLAKVRVCILVIFPGDVWGTYIWWLDFAFIRTIPYESVMTRFTYPFMKVRWIFQLTAFIPDIDGQFSRWVLGL